MEGPQYRKRTAALRLFRIIEQTQGIGAFFLGDEPVIKRMVDMVAGEYLPAQAHLSGTFEGAFCEK